MSTNGCSWHPNSPFSSSCWFSFLNIIWWPKYTSTSTLWISFFYINWLVNTTHQRKSISRYSEFIRTSCHRIMPNLSQLINSWRDRFINDLKKNGRICLRRKQSFTKPMKAYNIRSRYGEIIMNCVTNYDFIHHIFGSWPPVTIYCFQLGEIPKQWKTWMEFRGLHKEIKHFFPKIFVPYNKLQVYWHSVISDGIATPTDTVLVII